MGNNYANNVRESLDDYLRNVDGEDLRFLVRERLYRPSRWND